MANAYFQKKGGAGTIPLFEVCGSDAVPFKAIAEFCGYDTEVSVTVECSGRKLVVPLSASPWSLKTLRTKLGQGAGSEGNPFVLDGKRKGGLENGDGSASDSTGPFEVNPKRGSGLEGIHGRRSLTDRQTTIRKVITFAEQQGYVVLKAPPQSGKTALLELIYKLACETGRKCAFFKCPEEGEDLNIDTLFKQHCGGTLKELIDRNEDLLILLDEAQILYNVVATKSRSFWTQLMRLGRGTVVPPPIRVHVILAVAFGRMHNLDVTFYHDEYSPTTVPMSCDHPNMAVSVFTRPNRASLALDENDEYPELWGRFVKNTGLQLGDVVRKHIFTECAGQVGLIAVCLDFLERELVNGVAHPSVIDANALSKLMSQGFLKCLSDVRSLAEFRTLRQDYRAVSVMEELLWEGGIRTRTINDELILDAIRRLCQAGLTILDSADWLYFTTPLHRAYYMATLYKGRTGRSDWTVLEFLASVIPNLKPSILSRSLLVGPDCLLEIDFQKEVYRAILLFLPPETALSPGVGRSLGSKGLLDIYVPSPYCKVIEVTRDGKGMEQRRGGFLDPEKYEPMFACGAVKEHVVFDFRSPGSLQQAPHMDDDHVYTVMFHNSFRDAEVWHNGALLVVLKTQPV